MGLGSKCQKAGAPDATSFGQRLAALRSEAGYTQKDLANKIGVTRAKVAYYEAQTELPLARLLRALALALDSSADELLGLPQRIVPPPDDLLLQQRFRQIDALPSKERRLLIQVIDEFLKRERTQGRLDLPQGS